MLRRISVVFALGCALVGCAPGNPGLSILGVVAPNDNCTYTPMNPQFFNGTYDVQARDSLGGASPGYGAVLIYANNLVNLSQSGTSGIPMADPNIMYVREIEVELQDVGGAPIAIGGLPNPYRVPAGGGVVPSSDGSAAGQAVGFAEVIPPNFGAALDGAVGSTVILSVRAIGTTAGDAEVVSPVFTFPISICSGCLAPRCERTGEGDPICAPSCTPGQDSADFFCSDCPPST